MWWKSPEDAIKQPQRVVAQVMDIGSWDDVLALTAQVDDDALRDVLAHAEASQFNARSWAYWHYRLGLATAGRPPPLPTRKTA